MRALPIKVAKAVGWTVVIVGGVALWIGPAMVAIAVWDVSVETAGLISAACLGVVVGVGAVAGAVGDWRRHRRIGRTS